MIRVKAYYQPEKKFVNVTLRKPVFDLTESTLKVPAYTHVKGKTVSGRLTVAVNGSYVFS